MSTVAVMNAGSKTMNTNQYPCCCLSYKSTLFIFTVVFQDKKNNAFASN